MTGTSFVICFGKQSHSAFSLPVFVFLLSFSCLLVMHIHAHILSIFLLSTHQFNKRICSGFAIPLCMLHFFSSFNPYGVFSSFVFILLMFFHNNSTLLNFVVTVCVCVCHRHRLLMIVKHSPMHTSTH